MTKAKSAAPTPLELGRLLEDEGVLQAEGRAGRGSAWHALGMTGTQKTSESPSSNTHRTLQALELDRDTAMNECQQRGPQNIEVTKRAKSFLKEIHDTQEIFGVLTCFPCAHRGSSTLLKLGTPMQKPTNGKNSCRRQSMAQSSA